MSPLVQRLNAYERLIRLDRPIGTLLLLWPTLWALWIGASGWPGWLTLWLFALGTLLMRSAGCAINDFADRRFDGDVARTRDRPLPVGEIAPWEALVVAAALAAAAFGLVVFYMNREAMRLSVVALGVAVLYPFTKRFFAMPQAVLGVAFSFGIPMAFAALLGKVPPIGWWLMAATFFWVVAYDTEYAMVDREDDRKLGLKTSALLFGEHDVRAVGACYFAALFLLTTVGVMARLGITYYLGVALAAVVAIRHVRRIRSRARADCFWAFLNNNWFGAFVFLGIALDYTRLR
jgi:4-hydroxybenzoate polyprenyltransferase